MRRRRWRLKRVLQILPASHYLLLALLFFVGLELITSFHRWIVVLAVILLALIAYGIVLVRLEEDRPFTLLQPVLPVLAAVGLTGFSFFLPTSPLLHLYYVLAALVFFWLLKHGAKQAYPTWNWTISTIIFFLDMAVILGLRSNLFMPVLLTLGLISVASFLISLQALWRAAIPAAAVLLALVVALVLTQISWVLQFSPAHFLIQAGILVVLYYVLFHLLSLSLQRQLRREDITEYAVVGVVALVVLLATARWI